MAPEPPEQRAIDVFLDAAEQPADARDAFVASRCVGDPALEARVRQLLAAHAGAAEALGPTLVVGDRSGAADDLAPRDRLGPYELVARIGEGGFGTVWRARQHEPLERDVAVKIVKPGMDSREVVARFEAERQALALMSHPHIAQVHDAGTTDRGLPFFVMEFVDGEPITSFCARHRLPLRTRLEMFRQVCLAVEHAHQKGIVHRDLKPGNVLVACVDGTPIPKVIDFGVAKAIGIELTADTLHTLGGQIVGTPAYMSPEQAAGTGDIDTRTDVYSLGVLLYELLCGESPFSAETLGSAALADVLRLIRERDPPRPSTRIGRSNASEPRLVSAREVRGELDWIVMRCLEKDRERRYGSLTSLANEIGRFLRDEPVLARPPSVAYRFRKFARRNRTAVAAGVIVLGALVTATVVSVGQARAARLELDRQHAIANFLEHLLVSVDPAIAKDKDTELLLHVLGVASRQIEQLTSGPPEVEATLRQIIGDAYFSLGDAQRAEPEYATALALRERALGPRHVDTLESLHALGGVMLQTDRADEAERLLARCWEGRSEVLGADHEDTVHTLTELVLARGEQGDHEEAAIAMRALLEQRRRTLGSAHEETIRLLNNLGNTLTHLDRFEEAEPLLREAVERQIALNGREHPDTLKSMTNLAGVYEDLGRVDEAIALLEQALETKRTILPDGHPSLIIGLNNLAHVYERAGRDDEALRDYLEALASAREHLGPEHRITLSLTVTHGRMALKSGDLDAALGILEACTELCRRSLRANDRLCVTSASFLTEALLALGRHTDAVVASESLVADAAAAFPEGNPAHAFYRVLRGLALHGVGRDDEARPLLEQGIAGLDGDVLTRWQAPVDAALAAIGAR